MDATLKTFDRRVACLCGADDAEPRFTVQQMGCRFHIVRCRRCRQVYMDPRPTPEEVQAMYLPGYYDGSSPIHYQDEREHEGRLRPLAHGRLAAIERVAAKGRILDVGCAFGLFLDVARERGWETVGVDLLPYAVEEGKRKYRLDLRSGPLAEQGFPDRHFDAITLFEIVEHLEQPLEMFLACARILKPRGLLIIQTSNVESLYARWQGPRWIYYLPCHLYYFSPRTLGRVLDRAGLSLRRIYRGTDLSWKYTRMSLGDGDRFKGWIRHVVRKVAIGPIALGGGAVYHAALKAAGKP